MTSPENLRKVLDRNLADLGLGAKAQRYQVYILWPSIVGDIAKYAKPRRVDGESLVVATASSVWAQELRFMSDDILDRVNSALGAVYFREIHFSEHLWRSTSRRDSDQEGYQRRFSAQEHRPGKRQARTPEEAFMRLKRTMLRRVNKLRAQGFQTCPHCGHMFRKDNPGCPLCQWRTESEGYHKAMAVLTTHPELSDQEVADAIGLRSGVAAQKARSELEAKWMAIVWTHVGAVIRKAKPDDEARNAAAKLASLRSGKKAETLSAAQIAKILGPKLRAVVQRGDLPREPKVDRRG